MKTARPRTICLSVSKRNARYLDLINDYSLEFNSDVANTIFKIVAEYNTMRCLSMSARG
jgi:hypothetical protein